MSNLTKSDIYQEDEEAILYFCKYCGAKARSLLKNEDTCFKCFKIDEEGKTEPKYDSKTGTKI